MNGQRKSEPERTEDREPDPARSYERAKPEKESGMGRLDDAAGAATPTDRPDQSGLAVPNVHPPTELDADDALDPRRAGQPGAPRRDVPAQQNAHADHSMQQEEPLGEDLMPTDIHDPRAKRHPRKEGKGGTPLPRRQARSYVPSSPARGRRHFERRGLA